MVLGKIFLVGKKTFIINFYYLFFRKIRFLGLFSGFINFIIFSFEVKGFSLFEAGGPPPSRLSHKFLGVFYLFLSFWSGLFGLALSLVLRLELGHLGFFLGSGQL